MHSFTSEPEFTAALSDGAAFAVTLAEPEPDVDEIVAAVAAYQSGFAAGVRNAM